MSERRSTDLKIERLACVAARGMGMESFLVARPHCDKSHARQLKSPFVVVGENGAGSTVLQQVCSTKSTKAPGGGGASNCATWTPPPCARRRRPARNDAETI